MPSGELEKYRALILADRREFDRDDHLGWPEVVLEQALEEFCRGHQALAVFSRHDDARVERDRARRVLGGGIREREAAAKRAAVADCRMRDVRHCLRKQRHVLFDFRRIADLRMCGERADPHYALLERDVA